MTIFEHHALYAHIEDCVSHAQDHAEEGNFEDAHRELSDAAWAMHKLQSDYTAELGLNPPPEAVGRPHHTRVSNKLARPATKLG